jgi:DNA-binding transcriptional MerR regulator
MTKPLYLTTAPAARAAAISESTLRLWARAGVLPSQVTSTGIRLFTIEDVMRVARERARRPRETQAASVA